ncbi:MAG: acyltransferase, partial [Planctomycetota bacterium]
MGVLLTTVCILLWPHPKIGVTAAAFFANLTMFAPAFGQDFIDGVYWTLVYELKFYLMVFLLLLLGQQKRLEKLFVVWPLVMAIA